MAISAEKQAERWLQLNSSASHLLDPLTAEERREAASILKVQRQIGTRVRFETIVL